ncbi:threonine ammonia-lyase IlvA [Hasllibacter sp. MH4015]|uniref:threonine ammonia-lyase IlvA n=1 Tax=Hasllibacter sp. MH4015 TaxID=2854029 RepID=UPI001CD68485|nr:threonine ammonia-lyase IlvA [Hasllibacter sp. MH4015]
MTDFATRSRAATDALRDVFPPTPLLKNAYLSERYGADIWLKREDLSPVRSYKLRGAFNAMRKVRVADPGQMHFVCASAGNHAQGVAFVCAHFGVRGQIFMPVTTPEQKILKTRTFGGDAVEIVLEGDFFDETLAAAKAHCAEAGAHFLSPFDDSDVIEGQASVAVEMMEQLGRAPDHLVLPVGGGGLSAGMLSYLREVDAPTRATLVEPAGGASLTAALRIGAPQTIEITDTFVDGAAVARIGDRTFEVLRNIPPGDVLIAPENRICVTIQEMLNLEGIVLEPAGALSVNVLDDIADRIAGKTVVCVTSGGNFDFERLPEVKERAQNWQGLKKYFILRLPQRPGALRDFLDLLGPEDNITRFEYLKKNSRNFGSVLIGIETERAGSFDDLGDRVASRGFGFRDITDDNILADFLI